MTNASEGQVLFEVQDRVATITLNRPEAMNAMNRAVGQGIMEGLNRIEDDPDIRVGIITGLVGAPFFLFLLIRNKRQAEAF